MPVGNFCDKGGRFGPHQHAETVNGELNRFEDKIAWIADLNAGIRVLDLSDSYTMKAAWRMPPIAWEPGLFVPEYTGKKPAAATKTN